MEERLRREPAGVPWARTWMALGVASVVVGVLFAAMPYDRTVVLPDGGAVVRCEPPVRGAFGDSGIQVPADEDAEIRADCPDRARERLVFGVFLVLIGIAGFVFVRRLDRRRRGAARSVE